MLHTSRTNKFLHSLPEAIQILLSSLFFKGRQTQQHCHRHRLGQTMTFPTPRVRVLMAQNSEVVREDQLSPQYSCTRVK